MKIDIEVKQTGSAKRTATHPITGQTETPPTKWTAVQAIVNKLVQDDATAARVKMHGQRS